MNTKRSYLTFELLTKGSKARHSLLLKWLAQDHIHEWLHGDGLKNTLEDIENSLKGNALCQHWIALMDGKPFGYLITYEIKKTHADDYELARWCQKEGRSITLDLFIGNKEFIGKGLSVPMIQELLINHFSDVAEILIDPEASNVRAIHVYKKAGFKIIGEFIATWHPVKHLKMHLDMDDLKSKKKQ